MNMIKDENLLDIMKKYHNDGYKSLTETEILKLFLSYSESKNASDIAENIIQQHLNIKNLVQLDINYLVKNFKMNKQSAIMLNWIFQITKLCSDENQNSNLSNFESAKKYFQNILQTYNEENVVVVAVEKNMKIKGVEFIAKGETSWVLYSIQKVIAIALDKHTKFLFISHNHPKSNCKPSKNDIIATENIINSLKALDIILVDHIICGRDGAVSLRETISDIKFGECEEYNKSIEI